MMDKAAYFKRAADEVEKAKARLTSFAGECGACKWSKKGDFLSGLICEHPAVVCVAFNTPNAYGRDRIQECNTQRDKSSVYGAVVCGPDGALFESAS